MAIYNRQIANTLRMIASKGRTVTWSKFVQTISNSLKPWEVTNGTKTDYTPKIVFVTNSYKNKDNSIYIVDKTIPEGYLIGLMGAQSFIPTINDKVTVGSETYSIESIESINPNGEQILWKIYFKR